MSKAWKNNVLRALLRVAALVCFLCIPYTDLQVERSPKAVGDHLLETPDMPFVAPAVAQAVPLDLKDPVFAPLRVLLAGISEPALNVFFVQVSGLKNLNAEVFAVLVDGLPALAADPNEDLRLREALKKEFARSFVKYGPQPQKKIAAIAQELIQQRLTPKQLAQLQMAPDPQSALLEMLLREQLNQQMNDMGRFAQAAPAYDGYRSPRTAQSSRAPAAPTYAGSRNGTGAPYIPPAAAAKKDAPKAETASSKVEAPPRKEREEKEETAKFELPKLDENQSAQQTDAGLGKRTLLPAIRDAAQPGGAVAQSNAGSPARLSQAMPMKANTGSEFEFGTAPLAQDPARMRFNYLRENRYQESSGEEAQPLVGSDDSEIAWSSVSQGALGGGSAQESLAVRELREEPAFNAPKAATLDVLCAKGSLNCNRGR